GAMPGVGRGAAGGLDALGGGPGAGPMPGYPATGPMQGPPIPVPRQAPISQPPGPLPLAAVTPLPAVTLDHFGDGSGTVGAGLVWPNQPPHPHDPYRDGAG